MRDFGVEWTVSFHWVNMRMISKNNIQKLIYKTKQKKKFQNNKFCLTTLRKLSCGKDHDRNVNGSQVFENI